MIRRVIGIILAAGCAVVGAVLLFLGRLGSATLVSRSSSGNFTGSEYVVEIRWETTVPLAILFVIGIVMAIWRTRRHRDVAA